MRLSKLPALLLSLTLGTLAACGGSSAGSSTKQPAGPAAAGDSMCPVEVPGTSVTVEDTATGAALVFVTTGDAGELRRRVATMAKMHNEHHASMGPLPDGAAGHEGHDMAGHDMSGHEGHDMSGHEGHDMAGHDMAGHDMAGHDMAGHDMGHHGGMMVAMHSRAAATDVPGGARLELAVGPADVAKLQGELRMHAQHLASGKCSMGESMDKQPAGAAPAAPPASTDPHAGHH